MKVIHIFISLIVLSIFVGKSFSQYDDTEPVVYHRTTDSSRDSVKVIVTGGVISDFTDAGVTAAVSVFYKKYAYGLSYTSFGTGNVVTYTAASTFLQWNIPQTTYYAHLREIIAFHYGRNLTESFSITGGLGIFMNFDRSTTNAHQDPGGLLSSGAYYADLVEVETDYLAVPITMTYHQKLFSWMGLAIHAQAVITAKDIWYTAGISIGVGNYNAVVKQ
jgi:hypothetical protein